MPKDKLSVAICGGGIGGLVAAIALSKYPDISVHVYEAKRSFEEVGAGIGIWPRAWKVLATLGLAQELLLCTNIEISELLGPSFRFRKGDEREGLDFYTMMTHGRLITLHRADLQRVLLSHLADKCQITCSKQLSSYEEQEFGPIELSFADGTSSTCDVLIGADGIRSGIRSCMLAVQPVQNFTDQQLAEIGLRPSAIHPIWTGYTAYRTLISADRLKQLQPDHRVFSGPTQYFGHGGCITAYEVSQGSLVNFAGFRFRPPNEEHSFSGSPMINQHELAGYFQGWDSEVQALLEAVESATSWAIHTVEPLQTLAVGRVVLLGDAAHGVMPFQGAGAGLAIEGAYTLACLLGDSRTTVETIPEALKAYDQTIRPLARQAAEASALNGKYFTLQESVVKVNQDSARSSDKDRERLSEVGRLVEVNWQWAWVGNAEDSVQQALSMLSGGSSS
ncbi:hypothetical protein HGRIS_002597 [Hohenbuehelia grisea]|uniref:FAD-binding domain-containing protein n=1 Tax=Hohenbuehelia grisea TaxID=104357 RepID=A0ABR3JKW7_9AGAR